MIESLQTLLASLPIDRDTLIIGGIAIGVFLVIVGVFYPAPDTARITRRLAAAKATEQSPAEATTLLRQTDYTPTGLMKTLVPLEAVERGKVAMQLAHAGFRGRNAMATYYLLRTGLGLVLPGLIAAVYYQYYRTGRLDDFGPFIAGLEPHTMVQIVAAMVLVGFYGPAYFVRGRAADKRAKIENAFPNLLDLMKVALEAGMGFDAAMLRVAQEIHPAAPELAEVVIEAQREILAGRGRAEAYVDMSNKLGIDEARSFVSLILQSMQFGTSASQALTVYSEEMRQRRELRAQEKANKLPVQMSAVMAMLMLPALLLVTLGPVVIRYQAFMGN